MFRSLAALLAGCAMALAQPAASAGAEAAAKWVEARRDEVRRDCTAGPKRCVEQFESILRYLQSDVVREMSQGSQFLRWRPVNTYVDLAVANLQAGDKPGALRWLRRFCRIVAGQGCRRVPEILSGLAV